MNFFFVRESPSMAKGVRLRLLSLRGSWVQIPSPAYFIQISSLSCSMVNSYAVQCILHTLIYLHILYGIYNRKNSVVKTKIMIRNS